MISQSCASKERDSSEIERFMLLLGFYALYLSPLVKLISCLGGNTLHYNQPYKSYTIRDDILGIP